LDVAKFKLEATQQYLYDEALKYTDGYTLESQIATVFDKSVMCTADAQCFDKWDNCNGIGTDKSYVSGSTNAYCNWTCNATPYVDGNRYCTTHPKTIGICVESSVMGDKSCWSID